MLFTAFILCVSEESLKVRNISHLSCMTARNNFIRLRCIWLKHSAALVSSFSCSQRISCVQFKITCNFRCWIFVVERKLIRMSEHRAFHEKVLNLLCSSDNKRAIRRAAFETWCKFWTLHCNNVERSEKLSGLMIAMQHVDWISKATPNSQPAISRELQKKLFLFHSMAVHPNRKPSSVLKC